MKNMFLILFISSMLFVASCFHKDVDFPTHKAVKEGNLPEVKRLIEKDAENVSKPNRANYTPMLLAAKNGNLDIFKFLEKHGANINRYYLGTTPINMAAKHGNINIVKYLLDKGVSPKKTNVCPYSPLYSAVEGDNIGIVKLLLDKGAKVNDECDGKYPIHKVRSPKMVDLLIKHGADPNQHTGKTFGSFSKDTPLHFARGQGTAKELIKLGGKLEAKDINGNTPLMNKIRLAGGTGGDAEGIYELIDAGADVNTKNERSETPLDYAVIISNPKLVKALIKKGADKEHYSYYDETPLILATKKGRTLCVQALLEGGANPNARKTDNFKKTALDYAEMYNYEQIIKLLKQFGAKTSKELDTSNQPAQE